MASQRLLDYIKHCLDLGYKKTEIRNVLLEHNWHVADVDAALAIIEEKDGIVLIRPAIAVPVEEYTLRRKAQLLLNNAIDRTDYERVREEVMRMGFNPDDIPHRKP